MAMNNGGCRQTEIDDFSVCVQRFWLDFWSEEESEKALVALEAARRGEVTTFEGFCLTAKAIPRWWEVIVTPLHDSCGVPVRLLSARETLQSENAFKWH